MDVTIVGSGDAFGNGGRYQTCIALSSDAGVMLVDCGSSTLSALKVQGLDPLQAHTVVISHLHGDHFGGLPFLILDAQFRRRTDNLTVIGPPGLEERLHAAMEVLFPGSARTHRRFEVTVVELEPDGPPHLTDGYAIRGALVDHACGAPPLAIRVETGGTTVAYSGDTAWTPALRGIAHEADLLICEAYTWERPVKFHLSHTEVADHIEDLGARRLLLTHMSPDMLMHAHEAVAPTAYDGMTLTL